MFRFGCLTLLVLAAAAGTAFYYLSFDHLLDEVAVDLPVNRARARVQWWSSSDWMPRSRLVVETASGATIESEMWADWGVASRASLYVSPENWLIVLHPAGGETVVSIPENGAPGIVPGGEINQSAPDTWQFIGTVARNQYPKRGFRFYSPAEQRECIPMFGMKFEMGARYRLEHQAPQDCDWSVNIR